MSDNGLEEIHPSDMLYEVKDLIGVLSDLTGSIAGISKGETLDELRAGAFTGLLGQLERKLDVVILAFNRENSFTRETINDLKEQNSYLKEKNDGLRKRIYDLTKVEAADTNTKPETQCAI